MKYFLGVNKFAPIHAVRGDMGWQTCHYRRNVNIFRLWNRILSMNDNRLPKQLLEYEQNQPFRNWAHDIKQLFETIGLNHIFQSKCMCSINHISVKLQHHENQTWFTEKSTNLHKNIKSKFPCSRF